MKDALLEKLMHLFDECFEKRQATTSETRQPQALTPSIENWGQIQTIEQNTYFIKPANPKAKRVLNAMERLKLTRQSAQFLAQILYLDFIGERTLELIIDQLIFSPSGFVSLQETKATIYHTLVDSLTPAQLALLELVLCDKDDQIASH